MTVLPTVRRQIERAALSQANPRSERHTRPGGAGGEPAGAWGRRRVRVTGGGIVPLVGVAVALCVVIAAVVLLAHRPTQATSPAGRAGQYPLTAAGIGAVRFGFRPVQVESGLQRLLGLPEGASTGQRPHGLLRSICGFDYQIDWVGLPQRSAALRHTHSAGLTVYFRHSRFVGYSYGPPWGDLATPVVRDGVLLSTVNGLGLDEPLTRARRLYGSMFITTSQPQGSPPDPKLERLPAWRVKTASGLLYGSIDTPPQVGLRGARTIGSISAGAVPNTPCRTRPASHRVTLPLAALSRPRTGADTLPATFRAQLQQVYASERPAINESRRVTASDGQTAYLIPANTGACVINTNESLCSPLASLSGAVTVDLCSPTLPPGKLEIEWLLPDHATHVALAMANGAHTRFASGYNVYIARLRLKGPRPLTIQWDAAGQHHSFSAGVPRDAQKQTCAHPHRLASHANTSSPTSAATIKTITSPSATPISKP